MSSEPEGFRVEVLVPSTVREGLPEGGLLVVEEPVGTLAELTTALDRLVPGLGEELSSSLYTFAVNDEIVLQGKASHPVRSGDCIEVMPIFAGGDEEEGGDGKESSPEEGCSEGSGTNAERQQMFVLDENTGKVQLDYPCHWMYKVIGADEEAVREAIEEIVEERLHCVTVSNKSATGKYICLNLELMVEDEEDRQSIYEALKGHPDTTIIL